MSTEDIISYALLFVLGLFFLTGLYYVVIQKL
jgi:hypothetical protein